MIFFSILISHLCKHYSTANSNLLNIDWKNEGANKDGSLLLCYSLANLCDK